MTQSSFARYFGKDNVAATALDAILAFTPNIPNWAYNGAALGIGDFSNNAKLTPYGGWERVLQHYRAGSALASAFQPRQLCSPFCCDKVAADCRICIGVLCRIHSLLVQAYKPAASIPSSCNAYPV